MSGEEMETLSRELGEKIVKVFADDPRVESLNEVDFRVMIIATISKVLATAPWMPDGSSPSVDLEESIIGIVSRSLRDDFQRIRKGGGRG